MTYMFPADNIDPKLKGNEFIAAWGRAIDFKFKNNRLYISPADVSRLSRIRDYSNGNQPNDIYIDRWVQKGDEKTHPNSGGSQNHNVGQKRSKRKGYANLNWEIVSIAQTLKRIVTNLVGTETQFCDVESLTKESQNKKLINKWKTYVKAAIAKPLADEIGLPTKQDYFMPKDKVSLEIYEMVGGFNLNFEINAKKLIEHGLDISKYHSLVEKLMKEDGYNFNFLVSKIYCDPVDGVVKTKYIDPAAFICPWLDESQGDNMPFAGAYVRYSVPDLRNLLQKYYDSETAEKMLCEAAESSYLGLKASGRTRQDWSWYLHRDTYTQRLRYDEFFIDVLEFEFITKNHEDYSKRKATGDEIYQDFRKAAFGYKSKTGKKETVGNDVNMVYEGWYIPAVDKAVGGLQENIIRLNKKTPCLSYQVVKIQGKAIGESLIPLLDMLMTVHIKLQAAILAAKPKGIAVEITSLTNLSLGGEINKPQDIITVYGQNGIMIYKSVTAAGKVVNSMPITELEGGVGKQLAEWIAAWNHHIELCFQISGISPIMGASPDVSGEKLVGVANAERQATINNLGTFQDALEEMHQKVCKAILCKTLLVCKADKVVREYYANLVGETALDEVLMSAGLTTEQMGITITKKISPLQQQGIMDALLKAQTGGRDGVSLLDPSDDMYVRAMIERGRYEEGMKYLQYVINEKKKQYQEESSAASAQQAEQLQMLEQTKMGAEIEKEKAKAAIEIEKEKALSIIRVAEQKAIVDAEKNADAYLLQVEAMVQMATGKDTGTKIPAQQAS